MRDTIRRFGVWECVSETVVEGEVEFPVDLAGVEYFVGETLEDYGMEGSRLMENVVEARGTALWATGRPAAEERVFRRTWDQTGLSRQSEYYELPALKPRQYKTGRAVGWVRYEGHVFRAFDVKADGNCMFRAVSLGLYGNEDAHAEIRQLVVRELKRYWYEVMERADEDGLSMLPVVLIDVWSQMVQKKVGKPPSRRETQRFDIEMEENIKEKVDWICCELGKNGAWGGDESLLALTRVFDISLVVLSVESGNVVRHERQGRPEMYLRFVDGNHYHYLEPSKKCLEMPTKQK